MYSVTTDLINKSKAISPEVTCVLNMCSSNLGVQDIQSISIESQIGDSGKVSLGTTNSTKLNVVLVKTANTPVNISGTVIPYIYIGGTAIKMGEFKIKKASIESDLTSVSFYAYDAMQSYSYMNYNRTNYTSTRKMLTELSTTYGIKLHDLSTYPDLPLKADFLNMNVRQVIAELALVMGKNATIDRDGYLTFVGYTRTPLEIDCHNYSDFEIGDACVITRVATEGAYKGTTTGSVLNIDTDNITTQAEINALYTRLNLPFSYQALTLKSQGLPYVDCGDIFKLTALDGLVYDVLVINQVLTFDGALTSEFKVEATAESESVQQNTPLANLSNLKDAVNSNTSNISVLGGNVAQTEADIKDALTDIGLIQSDVATVKGDVAAINEDLSDFTIATLRNLEDLQGQIDGSIMTWFYAVEPTNSNAPAKDWTTTDDKNIHLGDLYYNTITGYCYRWQVKNSLYSWEKVSDVDITKALEDASKAQDTADSKRRVFTTQPKPPYEVGDLWTGGSTGELMRCKVTKLSGSYVSTDWEKATKYTDDTKAQEAIDKAATAQATADGKNKVFYAADAPVASNGLKVNDIWFETDNSNKMYLWNGTQWNAVQFGTEALKEDITATIAQNEQDVAQALKDAGLANSAASKAQSTADTAVSNASTAQTKANSAYTLANTAKTNAATAQSTADGKNTVFYQTSAPTAKKVNDVWFDTDDSNKMYYWNGSAWTVRQFGTDAIANAAITNALIKDATIESAKIANIDCAKLTSGFISSDRINAGSITYGKLNSAAVASINALVEVGAVNLFSKNNYISGQYLKSTGELVATSGWNTSDYINVSGMKDYIASGFTNLGVTPATCFYDADKVYISGVASGVSNSQNSKRKTLSIPDNAVYMRFSFATKDINTLKIEQGTKVTAYSPCPQDVQAEIDENGIGNWCYKNDLTYINGGKIYTGTIVADSLAANSVTSAKIVSSAITADKIAANTITASKMVTGTITAASGIIADSCITNAKIANATIESAKIKNIDAAKITTGTISADRIGANSITAAKIAAGTITGDKININDLFSKNITATNMTVTGGSIGGWKATSTDLYNDNGSQCAGIGKNGITYAFWAGSTYANRGTAPFRVGHDGNVYITSNSDSVSMLKCIYNDSTGYVKTTKFMPYGIQVYIDDTIYGYFRLVGNTPSTAKMFIKGDTVIASEILKLRTGQMSGIQCGSDSIKGTTSTAWTDKKITFTNAMPYAPKVLVQQTGGNSTENIKVQGITTNGFVVSIYACNGFTTSFDWVAVCC